MRQPYWDLYEIAGKRRPLWFDEHGVPRWVEFHPRLCNIYADEVALLEIACQSCGQRFMVALSSCVMDRVLMGGEPLSNQPALDWGDAPCFMSREGDLVQCAGSTMISETWRIAQFWTREGGDWVRCPEREVIEGHDGYKG